HDTHDMHDTHNDPPSSARILRLSAITQSDRPPFHETSARSKWHDVSRVEPTAVAPPRQLPKNATRVESNRTQPRNLFELTTTCNSLV
ncbi:hypothetical protein ALC57_16057, partial [Trachymyrmex cornetzi]